jgi:hypothetical protein
MRLFMGHCGCYKSSALKERGKAKWRVRTWSGGKAHDYWVENGQFHIIGATGDGSVARAEREAVLNMIAKWEADQLSDNAFQAAA